MDIRGYNKINNVMYTKKGLDIRFVSMNDVFPKDIFKIEIDEKCYYFEVQSVQGNLNLNFYVLATEYGYYNLPSKDRVPLHKIIGSRVEIIKDKEILLQLKKESCYT